MAISAGVIALYVFFGNKKGEMFSLAYYVPYLIIGILLATVIMNLAFLIQKIVSDCKKVNKAKKDQIKQ